MLPSINFSFNIRYKFIFGQRILNYRPTFLRGNVVFTAKIFEVRLLVLTWNSAVVENYPIAYRLVFVRVIVFCRSSVLSCLQRTKVGVPVGGLE